MAFRHVVTKRPVPCDLEIAHSVTPLPITAVAAAAGFLPEEVRQYGAAVAKVSLDVRKRLAGAPRGKYVVVVGINPTPLGEGKSTTTIGLAQALGAHLGRRCFACIRQPSLGPVFGVKGGAAGGGYSQVIPMETMNLHLTGDCHAIGVANNLLAAAIDTRIFHERSQSDEALYRRLTNELKDFTPVMKRRLRKLGIDKDDPNALTPEERRRFARLDIDEATVTWTRVVDSNDRSLRGVTIGQGKEEKGWTRQTKFEITVASEVMAILALAKDLADLRARLGAIQVARSRSGESITAEDIGCAGAMAVLLKDACEPSLLQTLEGTPVLVHAGPFGNIAHGNSSVIADDIALSLVGADGVVLTEAGFGADLGGQKFTSIKCRASGLQPDAAVIVATVRALKFHAGIDPKDAATENLDALRIGSANLLRHVRNVVAEGVPVVVLLNRFTTDTDAELDLVRELTTSAHVGASECVVSTHWADGGAGGVDAARALLRVLDAPRPAPFRFIYEDSASLKDKIITIATQVYGASGVEFLNGTDKKLEELEAQGFGSFPICMAKTQYSFSHDPALKGAPTGFVVPVREVRVYTGARFVVPLLGDISTMPGLPTRPAFFGIDIDPETGDVYGLS